MHELVLAGQGQAEARLPAVGETQFSPLADVALDALAGLAGVRAQRQPPLPQEAVEQLVAGGAVLTQHQDVRRGAHGAAQELFFMAWEGDAAELTWKKRSAGRRS